MALFSKVKVVEIKKQLPKSLYPHDVAQLFSTDFVLAWAFVCI